MTRKAARGLKIGVVGPCAAGKSTLIANLRARGLSARHIAQEHSYVPDMWRQVANPDVLIYLEVSYPEAMRRRETNLSEAEFQESVRRLEHARQHADLIIHTDRLPPEQVLAQTLTFLGQHE